jgi:recombination protein RecA
MSAKVTGETALDALIRAVNKQFGREVISNEKYEKADPTPTGSIQLDIALGIGGVPQGRIIEILGEESSGKTSLALSMLSQWQVNNPDKWVLIVDIEHSIDDAFMLGFGINIDKVIHVRTDSAEEALQCVRDLPKSGHVGWVIFDSVGGAQTAKMQQKDVGSADVGGISKLMHDVLRSIVSTGSNNDCTFVFLNQITYKIGVMFGNQLLQ